MEHGDRRLEVGRYQVGEKSGQLRAGEESLVHDRTTGERTREKARELGSRRGDALLHDPAGEIERPLPGGCVHVPAACGRGDQGLPDGGAGGAGRGPEHRRLDGDVAPAEHRQACAAQHVFDNSGGTVPGRPVGRQEEHPHRERLLRREREAQSRRFSMEEGAGDLDEQARPIARMVGGGGAAVRHAGERLERQGDDPAGALAGRPRHASDAAGVVLPPGVAVRRPAVGPARSIVIGHHGSVDRDAKKEGPLS